MPDPTLRLHAPQPRNLAPGKWNREVSSEQGVLLGRDASVLVNVAPQDDLDSVELLVEDLFEPGAVLERRPEREKGRAEILARLSSGSNPGVPVRRGVDVVQPALKRVLSYRLAILTTQGRPGHRQGFLGVDGMPLTCSAASITVWWDRLERVGGYGRGQETLATLRLIQSAVA